MMNYSECPLVTFAIIAYNQEEYIRKAIEGAFSQNYSSLEIILSDDNSTDNTFNIMREMAEDYTGPHNIILNVNKSNQGIGGHLNRIMELSKGDFVVINAGDDISLPERTMEMVSVWLSSNREAKSVFSDAYKMSTNGDTYGMLDCSSYMNKLYSAKRMLDTNGHVLGATQGWDREVFECFGSIDSGIVHDDCVLPLRALLLGEVRHISKPLVKYRDGGISADYTFFDLKNILYGKVYEINKRYLTDYRQKLNDIQLYSKLFAVDSQDLQSIAKRKINYYNLYVNLGDENKSNLFSFICSLKNQSDYLLKFKLFAKYQFSFLYDILLRIKYRV